MELLALILITVFLFPVYLLIRKPFLDLPLHRDTGFYVNNFTILNRRICYSDGWNAHHALCSKVFPEFFYSWIYLKHGGANYARYSRLYYSYFNYVTAIAVGLISFLINDYQVVAFGAGLILYGLLSSIPHFGVYFESGEQFEILFQVAGIFLAAMGLYSETPALVFWGSLILFLESFLIKTSSFVLLAPPLAVSIIYMPESFVPIVVAAFLAGLIYNAWVRLNKKRLTDLLFQGARHESYWLGELKAVKMLKQLSRKTWLMFQCFITDWPLFLIFTGAGVFYVVQTQDFWDCVVLVYLLSTLINYFSQSARIWYFLIPLLAPVSLLGVRGVAALSARDQMMAMVFCAALLIVWIMYFVVKYRRSQERVNAMVWKPYGSFMKDQNMELQKVAAQIKSMVNGKSIFIYGVCNQLYVLIGSSYPTSMISAAAWLEDMVPDWQMKLHQQFIQNPPQFIFTSDEFLDINLLTQSTGLDYRLAKVFGSNFKLYQFMEKTEPHHFDKTHKPYQVELVMPARLGGVY